MTKRKAKTCVKSGTKRIKTEKFTSNDLNSRFSVEESTVRREIHTFTPKTSVVFDHIEDAVIGMISRYPYVAVLCPYMSNQKILSSLKNKLGCSIVTTMDKNLKSTIRKTAFSKLTPLMQDRVRTLNEGRGKKRSILHSKVMVLLDNDKEPVSVVTGSYNFTGGSPTNIENVLIIDDVDTAKTYYKEFIRVYRIAKPFL